MNVRQLELLITPLIKESKISDVILALKHAYLRDANYLNFLSDNEWYELQSSLDDAYNTANKLEV